MKKGLFLGLSFLSFIELVEIVMKVIYIEYDYFHSKSKIIPKIVVKLKN